MSARRLADPDTDECPGSGLAVTVMAGRTGCGGMRPVRTSADAVLRALTGLRPEHRAVLVEVHCRKRTVTEAARHLGLPPDIVKARIYYALRALRLALDEGRESVR
jgi:DNA-directed RNA polymerase specialized sigma24 family protein